MKDFLNPGQVLKQLKLKKDMTACDFGSGSGGWVIPLAKKLVDYYSPATLPREQAPGKIYAIDILEEPLSALESRAALEKLPNVETIRANVEKGTPLASNSIDLVLMTNLLFECEDKKSVLEEGKRVLKKGGKILVVDWQKDNPLTPEVEFVSIEEVKRIAKEINLKLEKEFEAGAYHWGLILTKQ